MVWKKQVVCNKCKEAVSFEQFTQNHAITIRKNARSIYYYHDSCLPNGRIKLDSDWYGDYFLQFQNNQKMLIHQLPFMHGGIKEFANLLLRYKKGVRIAYNLRDCPWLATINKPKPLEEKNSCYFYLAYRPAINFTNFVVKHYKHTTLDNRYFILFEVARALEVFQAMNYVHRFLQPQYIAVDAHGEVFLSGFHLAKVVDSQDHWQSLSFQHSEERLYYPYYCSPEHLKGLKYTTLQTDVWSWGVIAYHLLTRASVYRDKQGKQIRGDVKIRQFLKDCLEHPENFTYPYNKNIEPEFNEILSNALQIEPEKRYTPTQLVAAMIQFLKKRS